MVSNPDEFLREFHAKYPGATSRAFAYGRDATGRSSYELLAAAVATDNTVLDLGCGDGYLLELINGQQMLGVDMSLAELQAARARPALADTALTCAQAQTLPIAGATIDAVVSHLAFMLMSDIETVCAEIARVLKPGGHFATITGGGPGDDDAFELFLRLFRPVYEASARKAPRYGDKRTRHGTGISELFGSGFDAPVESRHLLTLDGSIDRVWQSLSSMYECFVLDDQTMTTLHDDFARDAAKLANDHGLVPCSMRVRLVDVRKR